MIRWTGYAVAALLAVPGLVHAQAAPPAPPSPFEQAPWWMKEQVVAQLGMAYVELPANRASFTATFFSTDKTVAGAQGKAMEQVRGLQEVLGRKGRDKVVVSTDFTIAPRYKEYRNRDGDMIEDERGDRIEGYDVSLTVNVEVRDLSELQSVYSLVLAAQPTRTGDIGFSLQSDSADDNALQVAATRDARSRAMAAASAAGATLGPVRLIDPSGQACFSDVLGPGPRIYESADGYVDSIVAEDVGAFPDRSVADSLQRVPGVSVSRFSADGLLSNAQKNSFVQTPPIIRLQTRTCVVYGLN